MVHNPAACAPTAPFYLSICLPSGGVEGRLKRDHPWAPVVPFEMGGC